MQFNSMSENCDYNVRSDVGGGSVIIIYPAGH